MPPVAGKLTAAPLLMLGGKLVINLTLATASFVIRLCERTELTPKVDLLP